MEEALQVLNAMRRDGVIREYAIGGEAEIYTAFLRDVLARHGLSARWEAYERRAQGGPNAGAAPPVDPYAQPAYNGSRNKGAPMTLAGISLHPDFRREHSRVMVRYHLDGPQKDHVPVAQAADGG